MFLDLHYCKKVKDFYNSSSLLHSVDYFFREYLLIDSNYKLLTKTDNGEAQHNLKHELIQQILTLFLSLQYENCFVHNNVRSSFSKQCNYWGSQSWIVWPEDSFLLFMKNLKCIILKRQYHSHYWNSFFWLSLINSGTKRQIHQ